MAKWQSHPVLGSIHSNVGGVSPCQHLNWYLVHEDSLHITGLECFDGGPKTYLGRKVMCKVSCLCGGEVNPVYQRSIRLRLLTRASLILHVGT